MQNERTPRAEKVRQYEAMVKSGILESNSRVGRDYLYKSEIDDLNTKGLIIRIIGAHKKIGDLWLCEIWTAN